MFISITIRPNSTPPSKRPLFWRPVVNAFISPSTSADDTGRRNARRASVPTMRRAQAVSELAVAVAGGRQVKIAARLGVFPAPVGL